MDQARSGRVWATISASARQDGAPVSLRHAIEACAGALSAAGAGFSVARDGVPREPVWTSALAAEELEELQFTLGEGPGMEAVAGRGPVLVADLTDPDARRRWPVFAAAAAGRGVRGMFSFPVAVGAALVGVLDVYRLQSGALVPEELADGLIYADAVLVLALDERGGITTGTDGLADAFNARRAEVYQATGMVAAQLGVSTSDALAALRAHAYSNGLSMLDLAADVLARRVRLDTGPPGRDGTGRRKQSGMTGGAAAGDDGPTPLEPGQQPDGRPEEEA